MKWAVLVLIASLADNDVIEKVFERQAEVARQLAALIIGPTSAMASSTALPGETETWAVSAGC
ncbi:MAG: hypothetical protein ABIK44_05055 [candidate division WOR-3 bacterium]